MENTNKVNNEAKENEVVLDKGYTKVPLILGDITSKYGSNKYLKMKFENENGNEIMIMITLHENNDKERARIAFFNFYVNNIFKKLNKNDSVMVLANAKFVWSRNDSGYRFFYVVFKIKGRSIMFNFETDENMILSDALDSPDKRLKFFMVHEYTDDRTGELKRNRINIQWQEREYDNTNQSIKMVETD